MAHIEIGILCFWKCQWCWNLVRVACIPYSTFPILLFDNLMVVRPTYGMECRLWKFVPSLICCMPCFIYLCHVSYIYAMIYIFMPCFIYLCHVLYIYVNFNTCCITIHLCCTKISIVVALSSLIYVVSTLIHVVSTHLMLYQHKILLH